ncbi:hypothetical protein QZM56_41365, partial [Burkholderia contaminans]
IDALSLSVSTRNVGWDCDETSYHPDQRMLSFQLQIMQSARLLIHLRAQLGGPPLDDCGSHVNDIRGYSP